MIRDSGERTQFDTGAVRDMHAGKGRMDLLPWAAIMELSKHCEAGALKYGEHNVDKGIPIHSLIDSGMRHAARFWLGHDDEPHLTAACWNFLWALQMLLTKQDMDDRPSPPVEQKPVEEAPPESEPEGPPVVTIPPGPKYTKKPAVPGQFSGYGSTLKKEVFEALSKRREAGYTLGAIVERSETLNEHDLLDMLSTKKVPFAKWEAAAEALRLMREEEPDE